MPVIHVQTVSIPTKEQNAQIVKEFTETMVRVLGSRPDKTHIIIDSIPTRELGQRRHSTGGPPGCTGQVNPMATVELDRIRKVYESKVAVEALSLRIEPGTMFGLLGPNGSGKTSSIRMMIGITVPDAGTVKLFGKPFKRDSLKRVGYLPEERGLYKKMNVLEQISFMGQLRGLSAAEAEKRGRAWADRLQITEALPKKTEELSKGMQQKIQFITALCCMTRNSSSWTSPSAALTR